MQWKISNFFFGGGNSQKSEFNVYFFRFSSFVRYLFLSLFRLQME